MAIEGSGYDSARGRIRLGMVGGGQGAFIGAVHRIAARIDDQFELVAGALSYGLRGERINPQNANIHAVTGDALIELGRYDEAFAEVQKAVDLRPDLSTYSRASYALELQGDTTDARRALEMAARAGILLGADDKLLGEVEVVDRLGIGEGGLIGVELGDDDLGVFAGIESAELDRNLQRAARTHQCRRRQVDRQRAVLLVDAEPF